MKPTQAEAREADEGGVPQLFFLLVSFFFSPAVWTAAKKPQLVALDKALVQQVREQYGQ